MHDNGISFADAIEVIERHATGFDEVLGDDLKEVDRGIILEDVGVVDGSQTEAEAEIWKAPAVLNNHSELFQIRRGEANQKQL